MKTIRHPSNVLSAQGQTKCLAVLISAGLAGSLTFPAQAESVIPPGTETPAPFVTAPSIRPNVLVPSAVRAGSALPVPATPEPAKSNASVPPNQTDDSVPWVLGPELHPWPLRFRELLPLNALYLDLPSEQDARLMLPGRSSDVAEQIRYAVSKYISDALGVAAQARGRQIEALDSWVSRTDDQQHQLTGDPWQAYEFSLESRREVEKFRDNVAKQTNPAINQMALEVRAAINRIAPLVNVMPTFDLRTAWYDILVKLKEGLTLYQTQTTAADQQLLHQADEYLRNHPAAPRPAGEAPSRQARPGHPVNAQPKLTTPPVAQYASREASRNPAQPVAKQSSTTGVGGLLAIGLMLMGVAGIVLRLRRRFVKKAPMPTGDV